MMNVEGILGEMLKNLNIPNVSAKPRVENNQLVIELNENDIKNIAFKGIDENMLKHINLTIENNKIVIRIKLF